MKKISLFYSLLISISFAGNVEIKDFKFCENNKKETHTVINNANHQDTKNMVYLKNKYNSEGNKEILEKFSKYVVLSYGKGSKDFFVFVDPQCKYSRAFAKGSMEHLTDATYHIIFLPLEKHKDAKKMMSFIMDGRTDKDKFDRFKTVLVDEAFKPNCFVAPKKKALIYSENILKLTSSNKINKTPTFYKAETTNISKIAWLDFNKHMVDHF